MKPLAYTRSGLLTAAILVAAGCSSGGNGMNTGANTPQAQSPTISAINSQMIAQDSTSTPIAFTISDADSDVSTLKVTAQAANGDLIARDGIAIGGTGGSRTLTITPNAAAFGDTTVTIVVTDATGAQAARPFSVSVTTMAVSFLNFATQTTAADENSAPRSLSGLSFTQDADDPSAFSSQLMMN
jgi:hypothetical protein